jgi:invasion protein IalB
MMKKVSILGSTCMLAGLLFSSFPAASAPSAEAPAKEASKDAPAPVSSDPQTTSATYGDWVLRCSRLADTPQAPRSCEVVQSFQIQGQQGLFAQMAIGRVSAKEPLRITVVMQPNISFPSTIKASVDDKDTQPVELVWKRCTPGGCFADSEFKDETLKRWKAQSANGRLQFKEGTGQEITLPFSFRGLAQALDGLAKSPS